MISARQRATRLDYCQFLLSSQVNYTLTHFAAHSQQYSHDQLNRYLRADKLTPRLVWEQIKGLIVLLPDGHLLFDDTVADKNYSRAIEIVRRQYSGNAKAVIRGIGIVTCVYVNPETEQFWVVDYRIFDPDRDGQTKLDHVRAMFDHTRQHKRLSFRCVLMDAWYATRALMLHIERAGKIYYCPLKDNRQVAAPDATATKYHYRRADALAWNEQEAHAGKLVHIKDFPAGHQVKLFRLVRSTERPDYVVTNDLTQASTADTREVCAVRWKIEQLHREVKQLTGLESCQCRKARIQRNHVACAMLGWCRFKELAYKTGRTVYQIKYGQLSDYLIEQLKSPSVQMALA